jgi:hypothetical protein
MALAVLILSVVYVATATAVALVVHGRRVIILSSLGAITYFVLIYISHTGGDENATMVVAILGWVPVWLIAIMAMCWDE